MPFSLLTQNVNAVFTLGPIVDLIVKVMVPPIVIPVKNVWLTKNIGTLTLIKVTLTLTTSCMCLSIDECKVRNIKCH